MSEIYVKDLSEVFIKIAEIRQQRARELIQEKTKLFTKEKLIEELEQELRNIECDITTTGTEEPNFVKMCNKYAKIYITIKYIKNEFIS